MSEKQKIYAMYHSYCSSGSPNICEYFLRFVTAIYELCKIERVCEVILTGCTDRVSHMEANSCTLKIIGQLPQVLTDGLL